MNKSFRYLQNYLLFGLPFVLACMLWSSLRVEANIVSGKSDLVRALWEVLSWNLMLWFLALITFFVLLVVKSDFRDLTLKRIANIKDRDEREDLITGKASKHAYVSTLSILILLLFSSIFTIDIRRLPSEQSINGKTGTLSIGFHFEFFDQPKIEQDKEGQVLFESKDLPLTKSAILLCVLIWQIAAYNINVRRELTRDGT